MLDKSSRFTLRIFHHEKYSTTTGWSIIYFFNLISEVVNADADAKSDILFRSTRVLAYADSFVIIGRTTRCTKRLNPDGASGDELMSNEIVPLIHLHVLLGELCIWPGKTQALKPLQAEINLNC